MVSNSIGPDARPAPLIPRRHPVRAYRPARISSRGAGSFGSTRSRTQRHSIARSQPGHGWARLSLTMSLAVLFGACSARGGGTQNEVAVQEGGIVVLVGARLDTVMQSASHVLAQERIALRRYEPDAGFAESGFIDLARYPAFFDRELWDATERLVKLRFYAEGQDSSTFFRCEPLYNPFEVVTDEIDRARLIPVPQGHPGFEIATALTRRIAAHAEGRVVASP